MPGRKGAFPFSKFRAMTVRKRMALVPGSLTAQCSPSLAEEPGVSLGAAHRHLWL